MRLQKASWWRITSPERKKRVFVVSFAFIFLIETTLHSTGYRAFDLMRSTASFTRPFPVCPILRSPGAVLNWMAFAFEGWAYTVDIQSPTLDSVVSCENDHVGQRAVDDVLERYGVSPRLVVRTDLPQDLWEHPAWRISLAAKSLYALHDALPGLHELGHPSGIHAALVHAKIIPSYGFMPTVHASLSPGIHTLVDRKNSCITLDLPEAAYVWLPVNVEGRRSAWQQAYSEQRSVKRQLGSQERIASAMLRAACGHGLAAFEVMQQLDMPESLVASFPGWIPAQHMIQQQYPDAMVLLEGQGPDMLIVASHEDVAAQAAHLAQQTFGAHAITTTIHAWSTIVSSP